MLKKWIFLAFICGISFSVHAEKELSLNRYISGGVVGSILGFGTGHFIQGRYKEIGWVFTVGEASGLAALLAGGAWAVVESKPGPLYKSKDYTAIAVSFIASGLALFAGFKVFEIIDLWSNATPISKPSPEALYKKPQIDYLNKEESRFAGAESLGVAAISIPLFSYNF